MRPHTSEEISAFAKWLTQACQEAGMRAEQYGAKVRIIASCHFLTEEVECRSDDAGNLRWWWSWGKPITDSHDSARILTPDEVDDLVDAIAHVVAVPIRRRP
ncbi:hypothetical protein GCM10023196_053280 [Actinoallomurus vinaceus]|uniref:Uncharacterized protein n=2 Tax=Actinoallomurus vinaceus TaxID=1080074 RepID=A0ABP8UHB9_9ACTN